MIFLFLQGAALALPATLTPGPLQAFLVSRALRHGWRTTLPAALAPVVSDVPIVALILFVLTRLPDSILAMLRIGGGVLLLYLAWGILRHWNRAAEFGDETASSGAQSFGQAVALNLLNPNPYIFWGVVAGPILLEAWSNSPATAFAFVLGFYGTFVAGLSVLILAFATAGRSNAKVHRVLTVISGVALAAFGLYQIGRALL